MAQQVKFYSVNSLPSTPNAGGVYFIDGGELYKGSQRFGLGRVTKAATAEALAALTGVAKGDINVGYQGAKVYDGAEWQPLGGDIASLQSSWRADISTWTAGLVSTAQGDGTYIKSITQGNDGKVSATVSTFATDVQKAVGNATVSSSSNGVEVSVTTTSGKVTGVSVTAPAAKTWTAVDAGGETSYIYKVTQGTDGQVSALAKAFPTLGTGDADGQVKLGNTNATVSGWDTVKTDISNLQAVVSYSGTGTKTVTADTGTFTNLTVTDTATFSVTNVSASSLTVNGSTVEQIADARIAAITAATQAGASNGITVSVTTSGGSVTAVSVDATAFGNVMKFRNVVASTASITDPASGDIVVIGANPTGGAVTGQEYIYDGTKWELIGDQSTYAVNAYSSTATVYTGVETIPGALNAVGAAADTFKSALDAKVTTTAGVSDSTKASNLVTAGAVADYVAQEIGELGTAASKNFADTLTADGTSLPTESAVAGYVSGIVANLDASVSSSENSSIQVGVTQVDGVVTGVTADLVWLDASGAVIS